MLTVPLTILGCIWIAWAMQAVLSVMLVRKFARGLERRTPQRYMSYRPPVALVVPFKGLDLDLRANLRSLLAQDYPDHRLLLVVESEDDPAAAVIREELAEADCPAELLVAGVAEADEGQKVHNLIAAVEHLTRQDRGETIWAFADSDAVTGPHWLAALVGPLAGENTGVTTGYRWFVPDIPASGTGSRWSDFASVMNSSVACWAGRDEYNHAWGGSMAMRVETARRGDLLSYWRGALSDDYQVSRMCRDLDMRLYFVHRCLVASPVDFDLKGLWSFARRQYIITRTHAPMLYTAALVMQTLYVVGFVTAVAALPGFAVCSPGNPLVLAPLAAIVVVIAADLIRSRYRRRVVRHAFGEVMVQRLHRTLWIDAYLTPLWMTLHWLIVASAAVGRTIRWRGNRYRIEGPQRVRRLNSSGRL